MPSAAENVKKTSVENERLCKARAEAKFTWTMPSRRQTSVENEQKILCIISHYLQVSRNKIIFASY